MTAPSMSVNESPQSKKIVRLRHGGTEPQMEFWQHPARFRGFVGGVGSGKTRAGCVELVRQPPGTRATVAAPTYRMLEDATIQTFREVCGSFFRPENFNKSDNYCRLDNGSEIMFRSTDDPDKLRGPNLGLFWLDEAAMMPPVVWDLMIGRLRQHPGRGIVTTTPRGKNWLYKLFKIKNADNPDYHLTQCSSASNIFLPDYFIDALKAQYSGHWLKQELEGEFVEFIEAQAYEDFKSPVNVLSHEDIEIEDLYDPRLPLILACDFNNHIMAWPVIQVVKDQPYVITEIYQEGEASIPKMVRKFRSMFPAHAAGLRIYGDANATFGSAGGATLLEILEQQFAGYRSEPEIYIPRKNPKVIDRVHAVNQVLRGANLWQPLLIHHSAERLIEDFQRVQWKENGKDLEKIEDRKDDRSLLTHASDAFGYWVMVDMPASFEIISPEQVMAEHRETTRNRSRYYDRNAGLAGI